MSRDEATKVPTNRTENPIRRASKKTPERCDSFSYDSEEENPNPSRAKRPRRTAVTWCAPAAAAVVSLEQLHIMMDFLERNRDMALGRFSRTTEGRSVAKRGWEAFAVRMNMVQNGAIKTAAQWRQFYSEYKSRTLSKIRAKANLSANGGGDNRATALSGLQQRLCSILDANGSERLHGAARHNPLETNANEDGDNSETNRSCNAQPSSTSRVFAWSRVKPETDECADETGEHADEAKHQRRYSSDNDEPKPRRRYSCDNEFQSVGINSLGEDIGLGTALTQLNGLEQSRTAAIHAQSAALDRNTRALERLTAGVGTLARALTALADATAAKVTRDREGEGSEGRSHLMRCIDPSSREDERKNSMFPREPKGAGNILRRACKAVGPV